MSRLHLSFIRSSRHPGRAARPLVASLSALLLLAACGGGDGGVVGRSLDPEAITLTSLEPMYSVQGGVGPGPRPDPGGLSEQHGRHVRRVLV